MEVLGTAVGVASLGIQVCQGLLSYYATWKDYDSDVAAAYDMIKGLEQSFSRLKTSLDNDVLDSIEAEHVRSCVQSCRNALVKLEAKALKVREYEQPKGFSQKIYREVQRLKYPFTAKTLEKLKTTVNDIQSRLRLAIQIVALDANQKTQRTVAAIHEIQKTAQQSGQLRAIMSWLDAPDPWSNHATARNSHEPRTCEWLLENSSYKAWKTDTIRHIWLFGKPGCGKTVLSSTAIEDVKKLVDTQNDVKVAAFYFTFSDQRKQSFKDLIRSLVEQLGGTGPGLAMLQQAYDRPNRGTLVKTELENIAIASIQSCKKVYLLLDALDESPDEDNARSEMLQSLEQLALKAPYLKILATSRELLDIRESVQSMQAQFLPIEAAAVDVDIARYVSRLLKEDRRLSSLNQSTKELIRKMISEKADGMFRWAYCQISELRKLKAMNKRFIEAALNNVPRTLDATYERILTTMEEMYHEDALSLLRWITFAQEPPTLDQLSVAASLRPILVDEHGDETDTTEDFDIEGPLNILAGLVTIIPGNHPGEKFNANNNTTWPDNEASDDERNTLFGTSHIRPYHKLRLAHFSVKEYLISDRILGSAAHYFHLEKKTCDLYIAQSCVTYIKRYSSSDAKTQRIEDLSQFPLLGYAAKSWAYHLRQSESDDTSFALSILSDSRTRLNWQIVEQLILFRAYDADRSIGSDLYYACQLDLLQTVRLLLDIGADVDIQRGGMGENPLQAASSVGNEMVVRMLLDAGADVNAQGGFHGTALSTASYHGNAPIVKMLLDADADVNALKGEYGNPLQAASFAGSEMVVRMLLDAGADVNAQGGVYGTALSAASCCNDVALVKMLLDAGTDVNALKGEYDSPLAAASGRGLDTVVQMLLNAGADVNAPGHRGSALQMALYGGQVVVVQTLLDAGANVNAQGGHNGNALQATIMGRPLHFDFTRYFAKKLVQILLEAGADVQVRIGSTYSIWDAGEVGYYSGALQAASLTDQVEVVQILLAAGADVDAQEEGYYRVSPSWPDEYKPAQEEGYFCSALQAASLKGHEDVVRVLLAAGADVNAQTKGRFESDTFDWNILKPVKREEGHCSSALQAASLKGHLGVVRLLLDFGADINAQYIVHGHYLGYGNALEAAVLNGQSEIAEFLLDAGADVNARAGPMFGSPLHAASATGHSKIVQQLLDAQADVNLQRQGCLGSFGRRLNRCCTALQAASYQGQAEVVRILLDAGAKVKIQVERPCPSSGGQGGYYSDALMALERGWNHYLDDIRNDATDYCTIGLWEDVCSDDEVECDDDLRSWGWETGNDGRSRDHVRSSTSWRDYEEIGCLLRERQSAQPS